MAELETPPEITPEEIGQQIIDLAQKAEFGSPEFQALSDYFDKQDLLQVYQTHVSMAVAGGPAAIKEQSLLRISEMQLALLDQQIGQKKAVLPGYDRTVQFLEGAFDEIGLDAVISGETGLTEDEMELYEFPSDTYMTYHRKAEQIIHQKRAAV